MTKAPRYQPFYDLDGPKFDQLKADIALRGVVIPILVDEAGATIDGHQRRRACAELGVECPRTIVKGATEEDKLGLAIALNAHRRHLSGVERSKAVTQLRTMGWSIRSIAETLQVGAGTVHRDLAGVPSGTPDRVTGKDGKSYEAEQPPRPPADENGEPNGSTDVEPEDVEGEDPHPADEATTSPSHSQGGDDATPESEDPPSPPAPPKDPALLMHQRLSDHRKHVADWLAFDRHHEVIDRMTAEQREDYRSHVLSVFNHASATIDYIDGAARLKAVQ